MSNISKISANYQVDCWNNLSAMLDAAVAAGKILSNPCKSRSVSSPTRITRLITPWSERKFQAIEAALPDRCRIGVTLGGGLGLRVGEIHAFSPDFIDRERMTYRFARQINSRTGPLQFKLPKGHKERQIPISEGVLQRIGAYMHRYTPVTVTLPWAEQDGQEFMTVRLLLTTETNSAWWFNGWAAKVWKPAFATAGEPYEDQVDGTHALRHLYASHMLTQGVNIKELASFLGHTDEAFTLRKYVHLMPTSHDRARAAADAMFPPGSNSAQGKPVRRRQSPTSKNRPSGTSRRVAGRPLRPHTAGH
ncbi:tyrosine-type recombinase/integrase [Amycolatopsis sp. lyj-90]|uniref:tyrosine-type recombinase/integrase n=1 Tax=Amycolatopsis sp. lyj-90 TaxID=2789285 RepID=UPI00397C7A7E